MNMIIHSFVSGPYRAEVTDTFYVNVYNNDKLIDWPGPWDNEEGARAWAEEIIVKYDLFGTQESLPLGI